MNEIVQPVQFSGGMGQHFQWGAAVELVDVTAGSRWVELKNWPAATVVALWDNFGVSAVEALVSVEEYLHTVYEPDCDYVDGELVDRNVGEKSHAKAQQEILVLLRGRRTEWNIFPIQEARVQVSHTRYRVPDVCVFVGPEPDEEIFTHPPFLCIEILSPEDRMSPMQERIDDYLAFGVEYVWVIDPRGRRAWVYRLEGIHEVRDGVLRTRNPDIEIPLADVFPE